MRDLARAYTVAQYPRVVLVIDNAPWHRGALITQALKEHAHLEFYRLPSYSPQLQIIERFWRVLRRRVPWSSHSEQVAPDPEWSPAHVLSRATVAGHSDTERQ